MVEWINGDLEKKEKIIVEFKFKFLVFEIKVDDYCEEVENLEWRINLLESEVEEFCGELVEFKRWLSDFEVNYKIILEDRERINEEL